MMKHILADGIRLKSSMRWIPIQYNNNTGDCYFIKQGKRSFLNNWLRLHHSEWQTPFKSADYIHAVDGRASYNPDYIEIHSTGEAVRIYYNRG